MILDIDIDCQYVFGLGLDYRTHNGVADASAAPGRDRVRLNGS
jgi:hypothetical protein